jgi:hypothetical protein
VGEAFLRNQTDLQLPDWHPAVWPVQVRVHSGARLQFQRVAVFIDRPYARKRRIELSYDRLRASLQDRIQPAVASEGDADIRAECRLPRFLGVERFRSLAFADIAQNGQASNNFARIVEQRRVMTLNEYCSFVPGTIYNLSLAMTVFPARASR